MSQAALAFENAAPPEADRIDAIGFEIGWDHAHYRLVPPVEHLHDGHPVRQGWQAGQAVFGTRTLRATPPVRKWLHLRLNAWLRGLSFETLQVTPNHLAQIDVTTCPITREALTRGSGAASDASVDRVFNGAGYAGGNLAVMSVRANRAKADLGWRDALERARRIIDGAAPAIEGLDGAQWQRLAVLMSFVTPLAHAEAASLPLAVLPPNRLRLLNPVQALQTLLTLQFTRDGGARRLHELAGALPAAARHDFQVFLHTLLARRLAAGTPVDSMAARRAMEDAWGEPLVLRRWQRLALHLGAADCERLVQYAARRGLAGGGWRWIAAETATEGWALDVCGGSTAPAQAAATAPPRTPVTPKRATRRPLHVPRPLRGAPVQDR